jgi:Calx-beta domain/FG-GAP-like repeat
MRIRSWLNLWQTASPNRRARRAHPGGSRRHLARRQLTIERLEDRSVPAFLAPVNYDAGTNPYSIVTADFNGDGRLDLAAANCSDSTVTVRLGNGDGTFQAPQTSDTGANPLSLAVGDFNGDGKLDIVTANANDVSVMLGNGNGTFQAPSSISLGVSPRSVAVGDFNGDGKLDLGVTSNYFHPPWWGGGYYGSYYYPGYYDGYASVMMGNGDGSFSSPSTNYLGYGYHEGAAVGDFNADGRADFATADAEYSSVNVLLSNADGSLGGPSSFSAGYYPVSVAAGDVNGDGKADLVTANLYGGNVSVLLGDGLGSFGSPQDFGAGSYPQSVAMADFNGDGHIDLVTANPDAGAVSVLLGDGTGAFTPPVNAAAGPYSIAVAVGDFNGDGRPDAASANYSGNNVSVLINDNIWPALDAPSITIDDVSVTEGNSGTTNAAFTVNLSSSYSKTVTVHYSTADGSAVAGDDYQATSGVLTFAPGETSKTILVPVIGDHLFEYNEYFTVQLVDPTNAFVVDATGYGTILDDEPYISIDSYSHAEGNSGTTAFTFTVSLSTASDEAVTVDYTTADFTPDEEYWYGPGATAGSDYIANSGTLTIPAGDTSATITVLVNGDRNGEYDESFWVNLSNPSNGQFSSSQAIGTILNDEPYVSIDSTSVAEGNTGTTTLTFNVTLSAASDAPVIVNFATNDGSATVAGGDYQSKAGTVTFAPGETSKPITVLVNGDRLGEYDEYMYVSLADADGALIGNGTGYGTIFDNEPRISINSVSITEGNSGTRLMTFTMTLSHAYDQAVTVKYATHDDTAKVSDNDYVAASGTLTFSAGQTSKTFTVTIKGDKKKEADEYFYVLLSDASTNALIYNAYGWGTIRNDDSHGKGH